MKDRLHPKRGKEPWVPAHPGQEGELASQHGQGSREATDTQRTGVGKRNCCCSGVADNYKCSHNLTALALLLMKFPVNLSDSRFHSPFSAFQEIFCHRFKTPEFFTESRK